MPVPTFALLTRLLLCLSLLLNGTAAAIAMPGLQARASAATPVSAAHVADAASAPAAMPCHDHAPPPPERDGGCHDHAGKHGCGSMAGCQCPHAQPLPALLALPLPPPARAGLVPAARHSERGAPGLPRPERPPSA